MKFQTLPLLDEGTLARSFFKGCAARDIFGLSLFSTTSSALDHSATEPPPLPTSTKGSTKKLPWALRVERKHLLCSLWMASQDKKSSPHCDDIG